MEFGLALFGSGSPSMANPEILAATAQRAESLGIDSVWIGDHVVMPVETKSRYPYSQDGKFGVSSKDNILEPIIALSFVGGMTSRIRLGFSVLILPYRHPVLMAKMVSNLDYMTGGRVELGVGVGWLEEEFRALGSPPFQDRGVVTDEAIQIFKAVCAQSEPTFHGKFFRIEATAVYPKSVQQPHPPIWVGGNTEPALRRVVRVGNGWQATALTPEQMTEGKAFLNRLCNENKRDLSEIKLGIRLNVKIQDTLVPDDQRMPHVVSMQSGTLTQLRDDLHRYQEIGVSSVVLRLVVQTPEEAYEQMDAIAALKSEFA